MLPAINRSLDQSGSLENLHVPADRRFAYIKRRRKLSDRRTALYEARQNAPARAVRERKENLIELLIVLHRKFIVNRLVNYNRTQSSLQMRIAAEAAPSGLVPDS